MDAFSVTVDHEEMVVTLQASLKLPGTITTQNELNELLKENNVFKGIDTAEINKAFKELKDLKESKTYIAARGKPPINGVDGKLDFHVNVSGKAEYVGVDDNGEVDYKNAVSVESVVEGAQLITIIHPTPGVDGYNLSGKVIAAKNGKEVNVILSEGAEFNADRTKVIATSHGRPVLSHGIFSVRSVYDVSGDVCFETGNIYFNGHVNVFGNVQDEFVIEAESIEINGVVGNAKIKSKGDLVVRGGVNGKGKSEIICGGNAEIKYINAANVEVKKDLIVKKEIVNAEVRCNGKVVSKKIIGGSVSGLKGIEAMQIGSEVGTPTLLKPGLNYEVERIEAAMSVLSSQIESAIKPIKNSIGDRDFFKKLSTEKQEVVIKACGYFKKIKNAYIRLLDAKDSIMNNETFEPVKEVVLLSRLYQDVQIKTALCSKRFMKEVGGPVRVIEDVNKATMKNAPYQESGDEEDNSEG